MQQEWRKLPARLHVGTKWLANRRRHRRVCLMSQLLQQFANFIELIHK